MNEKNYNYTTDERVPENKSFSAGFKFSSLFKYILPFLIISGFYLLAKILSFFPSFTEKVFSRGIFRVLSFLIGKPLSLIPFSITELTVIILLPLTVIVTVVFFLKRKDKLSFLKKMIRVISLILCFVYSLYTLLHGINFYRKTAAELFGYSVTQKTYDADFLYEVCVDLAKKASLEREGLLEDENGYMKLKSKGETLKTAGDGYKVIEEKYPFLKGSIYRAKGVILSKPWSYTGIIGMYSPFFNEANVNIYQPDSSIPETAAHELAHTRGFAREDESNFLSFLSSINHPSAEYRYSGYSMAYYYCISELYALDDQLAAKAQEHLSAAVIRDSIPQIEFSKEISGPVKDISTDVNDSFIQSQGVEEGVKSYDRVSELIILYYEYENILG